MKPAPTPPLLDMAFIINAAYAVANNMRQAGKDAEYAGRLIAAAPDMAQALRLMRSAANWAAHESAMVEVNAILAKIEGK